MLVCHRRSYLLRCLPFFPRWFGAAGGAGRSRSRPGCLILLRAIPIRRRVHIGRKVCPTSTPRSLQVFLQTLDENLAARRARVRAYQDLLKSDERLRLIAHQPGSACLSQVVRVLPGPRGNDLSAHLVEALHSAGYEVQGSYVPIHLLACYRGWARQRLPYAERVWSDLIELPCEPEVSLTHVERIARIIRQVLGNCVISRVKGSRPMKAAVAKAGQK